ncbi:GGDEF domain-containing protein [Deinococcus radiomollis]|uniref:GGDEF domain-containing protein n=1 Tax=Deinococcus radiomollis TaxID=468916 RepID=UPI00389156F6
MPAVHESGVHISGAGQHATARPSDADRPRPHGQSWLAGSLLALREQAQRLSVWQARDSGLPRHDELTGLPNRRTLNERLQALLNAADRGRGGDRDHGLQTLPGRGQQGWSVLLVDIDFFRSLNETHGRPAGDEVLKVLTACLRQELRTDDVLGRWNGDEFLVLLPATGFEGALVAAERLRRAVSLRTFPHVGGLTVSIGVASSLPGDGVERVVTRADAGVEIARQSGRNRVAFSE